MKNIFLKNGLDITPEEMIILFLIKEEGSDQGTLVTKSLKDKTNITRLLTRMETKSLIIRQTHTENNRQQIVFLTTKGEEVRTTALPLMQQMIKRTTQGISVEDMETTRTTLNKISQNIK
ncbi:MarR family winged helix-turn-helix transcriptional regulator [Paremcibacter congregatus]|nr:MarR family transcriptional regulator [Paremcibacter congregatus]